MMKKFLIRTSLFLGSFIGIYFIFIARFIYLSNKVSFEIEPDKNILVLGDSQGQFCISDTIVDNAYNLCRFGEGYLPNYLKLKRVLESPNHIDTLLLIFTPLKTDKNADNQHKNHKACSASRVKTALLFNIFNCEFFFVFVTENCLVLGTVVHKHPFHFCHL